MPNKIEPKTLDELRALHTGTLMSRRKALLECKEKPVSPEEQEHAELGVIEFKNTPQWQKAYAELKAVLAEREHIPNKKERKAQRQAKAKR